MVHEFEPHLELCADSVEPAWDSLSPSLSLRMLTLSQNKQTTTKLLKKKDLVPDGFIGEFYQMFKE